MNRFALFGAACALLLTTGCDSADGGGETSHALSTVPSAASYAENATEGNDVRLTSMCRGWWRVTNLRPTDQDFSWQHVPSGTTGTGTVAPSASVFFQAPHASESPNTVKLFDGQGQQDDVKASNNGDCPTLGGAVHAIPDGSTDPSEGASLQGVRVQVFFAGMATEGASPIAEATTTADGRFSFELPAFTSSNVPYVDYVVVIPADGEGALNADLFAYFTAVPGAQQVVRLPNASRDDVYFGFDGNEDALSDEVDAENASRAPWSQKDLRKAFDRARKNKPCHDAVLCRDELLEVTWMIVDDPDDPSDAFFGLSVPYTGPSFFADGQTYTDAELLEWGYEVLRDVPKGPQSDAARLYGLVFACEINYLRSRGLQNGQLDYALQMYFEAEVRATISVPERAAGSLAAGVMAYEPGGLGIVGGGGGGVVDLARTYLGGSGGGTVDE